MKYYSTNNKNFKVSFREAILTGMPEDKGLFMPEEIIKLEKSFIKNLRELSLTEIAYKITSKFIENEINKYDLKKIVEESFNFNVPLVEVEENIYSLELFHGPTMAFKDFGARFMARVMSHFLRDSKKKLTILVATSGDTGSAVASGYLGLENIDVILLYPKNKISKIQEKQLTTFGENIKALEINGTFDDCQSFVKKAFVDNDLKQKYNFSSANSINISRLIPQMIYYFHLYSKIASLNNKLVISIPSGNFGNLTAGLFAKKMGLPIDKFIASTNINKIVPHYLETGDFISKKSKTTISNAMDIGNPSNFTRMLELLKSHENMKSKIKGYWFTDEETKKTMANVYKQFGYILEPHGAIGYMGLKNYLKENNKNNCGVFFETAHPAKFKETVEKVIKKEIEIPDNLKECLIKDKQVTELPAIYKKFKEFLVGD